MIKLVRKLKIRQIVRQVAFTHDLLSFLRLNHEFTFCFANKLWIQYLSCNEFIWCLANKLLIHYLFSAFTMNQPSLSRIHCKFVNIQWIHHESLIFSRFAMTLLSFLRINYKFTIFFANYLFIIGQILDSGRDRISRPLIPASPFKKLDRFTGPWILVAFFWKCGPIRRFVNRCIPF